MGKTKKAALILFLLFFSFSLSFGIDISLKLSGGLSYIKLDDINRSLKGWEELWKKTTLSREDWEFAGGGAGKLNIGYNFEGEIIFSLSPHLAASFGIGLIYSELVEEKIEVFINANSNQTSRTKPTKVNAQPLTLSGYFFYPVGKKLDVFIKGGAGLIWAKYIERQGWKPLSAETYNYGWQQEASAQGPVFLGGLGIIYRIDDSLGLFIEGGARWAKISGFQGETSEGEEGNLYFLEELEPDIGFWQTSFMISAEEPSGDNFRSIKKAVVDFSGFSARIGLLIRF